MYEVEIYFSKLLKPLGLNKSSKCQTKVLVSCGISDRTR